MNELVKPATQALGDLIANTVQSISSSLKGEVEIIRFRIEKGLTQYANEVYVKCSTTKTLINRNSPIEVNSIYVGAAFRGGRNILRDDDVVSKLISGDHLIITGFGGSGKSIFMKWALLQVIERSGLGFPIFFELRNYTDSSVSLVDRIFQNVSSVGEDLSKSQFLFGLKNGYFSIFLDGFDELHHDLKAGVEQQLDEICFKFPKTPIIVSSRPDRERFGGWEKFSVLEMQPLTLEQVLDLVDKVDIDRDGKGKIKVELSGGAFEKFKGLYTNPLLATMMLMVSDKGGRLPSSETSLFRKCFDVLSVEHDAMKRYTRKLKSPLTIEQAREVFRAFCALGYLDETYEFSDNTISHYVLDAIDLTRDGSDVESADIIHDFTQSLSLILEEGDVYSFIHRSFQEFFFAEFVMNSVGLDLIEILSPLICRFEGTKIFLYMSELNRERLICEFLLPFLKSTRKKLLSRLRSEDSVNYMARFADSIGIRRREEEFIFTTFYLAEKRHSLKIGYVEALHIAQSILSIQVPEHPKPDISGVENLKEFERIEISARNRRSLKRYGIDLIAQHHRDTSSILIDQLEEFCANASNRKAKHILSRAKRS